MNKLRDADYLSCAWPILVCRVVKVTVSMWLAVENLRSWQPRFISFFFLLIHYITYSRHFIEIFVD